MTEMLPILAHGETYAQAIVKRGTGAPKPRPHEYEEARERLLSNVDTVLMQIDASSDLYLNEKIVCVRMEPKFEAKSYTPSSILTVSNDMKLVGGRKYKIEEKKEANIISDEIDSNHPEYAKLYFLRATIAGLTDFRKSLRDGLNTTESWRNEIMSLHSIDLLSPEEKILGFNDGWKDGLVEAVLHPFKEDESEEAINLFCKESGLDRSEIEVRSYKDGVTFIAAKLSREAAAAVARINPLRTVHPMGRISFEPIRSQMSSPAPKIQEVHGRAPITVGVFDGGVCRRSLITRACHFSRLCSLCSITRRDRSW